MEVAGVPLVGSLAVAPLAEGFAVAGRAVVADSPVVADTVVDTEVVGNLCMALEIPAAVFAAPVDCTEACN